MLKWYKTLNLKVIQEAEGSTNCHQSETATLFYQKRKKKKSLGNKNKQINKRKGKVTQDACISE